MRSRTARWRTSPSSDIVDGGDGPSGQLFGVEAGALELEGEPVVAQVVGKDGALIRAAASVEITRIVRWCGPHVLPSELAGGQVVPGLHRCHGHMLGAVRVQPQSVSGRTIETDGGVEELASSDLA